MAYENEWLLSPGASRAREVVDPNRTLPTVALVAIKGWNYWDELDYDGNPTHGFSICHATGEIGQVRLSRTPDTGDVRFCGVNINKTNTKYQKGMGVATYLLAIESAHAEGKSFVTDFSVSASATRVWNRFVALGLAEVREPFTLIGLSNEDPPQLTFTGDIAIPPL